MDNMQGNTQLHFSVLAIGDSMRAKIIPFLIMFTFVISDFALARDLSVRSRGGQSLAQRSFDESSAKSRGAPQHLRCIPGIDISWPRHKQHRAGIQSAFAGTDKQITALCYNSVRATSASAARNAIDGLKIFEKRRRWRNVLLNCQGVLAFWCLAKPAALLLRQATVPSRRRPSIVLKL